MHILRDLSLILLAVESFILALIPLALCGGLVYGLWWLRRRENLPRWLQLAQAYLTLARAYVELAMAVVVKPILALNSALATAQGWLSVIAKPGGER